MAKKKDMKNMRPTLVRTEGGINQNSFSYDTSNFWDQFPEVKLIFPFDELYVQDKSTKKKESSMFMWGLHLLEHPASAIYNLPDKGERVTEKIGVLIKYDYEVDEHKYRINYRDCVLPEAYRLLTRWYEKLMERSDLLEDTPYNIVNLKVLDEAMKMTKPLWDAFGEIRDQVMMQEGQEIDGKTLAQQKTL